MDHPSHPSNRVIITKKFRMDHHFPSHQPHIRNTVLSMWALVRNIHIIRRNNKVTVIHTLKALKKEDPMFLEGTLNEKVRFT